MASLAGEGMMMGLGVPGMMRDWLPEATFGARIT